MAKFRWLETGHREWYLQGDSARESHHGWPLAFTLLSLIPGRSLGVGPGLSGELALLTGCVTRDKVSGLPAPSPESGR